MKYFPFSSVLLIAVLCTLSPKNLISQSFFSGASKYAVHINDTFTVFYNKKIYCNNTIPVNLNSIPLSIVYCDSNRMILKAPDCAAFGQLIYTDSARQKIYCSNFHISVFNNTLNGFTHATELFNKFDQISEADYQGVPEVKYRVHLTDKYSNNEYSTDHSYYASGIKLNYDHGHFHTSQLFHDSFGSYPKYFLKDMNADGLDDMIYTQYNDSFMYIRYNTGLNSGGFINNTLDTVVFAYNHDKHKIADIDGDGINDIIDINQSPNKMLFYKGYFDSNHKFRIKLKKYLYFKNTTQYLDNFYLIDANNDGLNDFVFSDGNQGLYTALNHVNISDSLIIYKITDTSAWGNILITDFNNDNKQDVCVHALTVGIFVYATVLYSDHFDLTLEQLVPVPSIGYQYINITDFNFDGKADIIICQSSGSNVSDTLQIYFNTSVKDTLHFKTKTEKFSMPGNNLDYIPYFHDVNHDGFTDVIISEQFVGIKLYLNQSKRFESKKQTYYMYADSINKQISDSFAIVSKCLGEINIDSISVGKGFNIISPVINSLKPLQYNDTIKLKLRWTSQNTHGSFKIYLYQDNIRVDSSIEVVYAYEKPVPFISNIQPQYPASVLDTISLYGNYFNPDKSKLLLSINNIQCPIISASEHLIKFQFPNYARTGTLTLLDTSTWKMCTLKQVFAGVIRPNEYRKPIHMVYKQEPLTYSPLDFYDTLRVNHHIQFTDINHDGLSDMVLSTDNGSFWLKNSIIGDTVTCTYQASANNNISAGWGTAISFGTDSNYIIYDKSIYHVNYHNNTYAIDKIVDLPASGNNFKYIGSADMDLDGFCDVVIKNDLGQAYIYSLNFSGTKLTLYKTDSIAFPAHKEIWLADIDHDHKLDYATFDIFGVDYFRNMSTKGNLYFQYNGTDSMYITEAWFYDMNNDGIDELIYADNTSPKTVIAYLSTIGGNTHIISLDTILQQAIIDFNITDINNDSKWDILGKDYLLMNNIGYRPSFIRQSYPYSTSLNSFSGDINGNYLPDGYDDYESWWYKNSWYDIKIQNFNINKKEILEVWTDSIGKTGLDSFQLINTGCGLLTFKSYTLSDSSQIRLTLKNNLSIHNITLDTNQSITIFIHYAPKNGKLKHIVQGHFNFLQDDIFHPFEIQARVYEPPVITSFSPYIARVGDTVTLKGKNFDTTSNFTVFIGTTRSKIISRSGNQMQIQVPKASSTNLITVSNTDLNLVAMSAKPLSVNFEGTGNSAMTSAHFSIVDSFYYKKPGNYTGIAYATDFNNDSFNDIFMSVSAGFLSGIRPAFFLDINNVDSVKHKEIFIDINRRNLLESSDITSEFLYDIDGDGYLDQICGNMYRCAEMYEYVPEDIYQKSHQGLGNLGEPVAYDLNHDGFPDITEYYTNADKEYRYCNNHFKDRLLLIQGPSDDEIMDSFSNSNISKYPDKYYMDFNNDGLMDMIYARGQFYKDSTFYIAANRSKPYEYQFLIEDTVISDAWGFIPKFSDMNNDGLMDIVTAKSFNRDTALFIYENITLNGGKIEFRRHLVTTPGIRQDDKYINGVLQDLNGDQKNDLVIPYYSFPQKLLDSIIIFTNLTDSTGFKFSKPLVIKLFRGAAKIMVSDMNNDGKPDIVAIAPKDKFSILWNNSMMAAFSRGNRSFPNLYSGQPFTYNFTIKSTGGDPVIIETLYTPDGVELFTSNSNPFSLAGGSSLVKLDSINTIAGGDSIVVQVVINTDAPHIINDSFVFKANYTKKIFALKLKADIKPWPKLVIVPEDSLTLSATIHTKDSTRIFLKNEGYDTLIIDSIKVLNPKSSKMILSSYKNRYLVPGDSNVMTVAYGSTTPEFHRENILIYSNVKKAADTVLITCKSFGPIVTTKTSPQSVSLKKYQDSICRFTIKNIGNANLILQNLNSFAPHLDRVDTNSLTPILPGDSIILTYLINSQKIGYYTDSILVSSNAIDSQIIFRINIRIESSELQYNPIINAGIMCLNENKYFTVPIYNKGNSNAHLKIISYSNHNISFDQSVITPSSTANIKIDCKNKVTGEYSDTLIFINQLEKDSIQYVIMRYKTITQSLTINNIVNFGLLKTHQSINKTIRIINIDDDSIALDSIYLKQNNYHFQLQSPNATIVKPFDTAYVNVTCSHYGISRDSNQLICVTGSIPQRQQYSVLLNVYNIEPSIAINQFYGYSSQTRTNDTSVIKYYNAGNDTLSISSITLSVNQNFRILSANYQNNILPGQSDSVIILHYASNPGIYIDTLTIASNCYPDSISKSIVTLHCNPVILTIPEIIIFGTVSKSTTKDTVCYFSNYDIYNSDSITLIKSLKAPFINSMIPSLIAKSDSIAVTFGFHPSDTGYYNDSMVLLHQNKLIVIQVSGHAIEYFDNITLTPFDNYARYFPNPTDGLINLYLQHPVFIYDVIICNATGQKVETINVSEKKQELALQLSELPKGEYIIQIKTSERVLTCKVIKI